MAETDFVPMYATNDPSLRPSLVARQGMAGYRAPGFIGRALAGAQPNAAPQVGATSSGDGTAALRGLYAARAGDDFGVGNSEGAIAGGQQPTRETQSFQDLLASAALGGLALTGPGGFGAVMNVADRMGYDRNVNGPVGWGDVKSAVNPFGNNSTISRALAAGWNSVTGGANNGGVPGFDPVTGMAPGEKALGIDRSVTSEPLAPPGGANNGGVPGFDPVTGMAPGIGPEVPVESAPLGPVDSGGAGAGSTSETHSAQEAAQGPENPGGMFRTGGFVGKPGSTPQPVNIQAHTGEAVMRPEAVNKYGPSAMRAINSMKAPAPAVKAATGGAPQAKKGPPAPAKKAPPSAGKKPPQKGVTGMDALAKLKARG